MAEGVGSTVDDALEDQEEETLWTNPVFESLRVRVKDFEKQACELGWLIFVPRIGSLEQTSGEYEIGFLKRHVVFPSPYLRGEYINFSGSRLTIDNGIATVKTKTRGCQTIRILFEETCFGAFGSYKALCVSAPIDSGEPGLQGLGDVDDGNNIFDDSRSVDEWMFVLNREAKNSKALRYLEDHTDKLKTSYVLVANKVGISDFLRRIDAGVNHAMNMLIKDNPSHFALAAAQKGFRAMLRRALEAYAFFGVHSMVFGALINLHSEKERMLRGKIKLEKAQHRTNGVFARNSKSFFEDINKRRCPLAKLEFLRDYLQVSSKHDDFDLNADNILSTLVERLIYIPDDMEEVNILANLQYVRSFTSCDTPNDLNYLLCQFHGAVCFVFGGDVDDFAVEKTRFLSHPPLRVAEDKRLGSPFGSTRSSVGRSSLGRSSTGVSSESDDSDEDDDSEEESDSDSDGQARSSAKASNNGNLGGFLMALKSSKADVITSSSSNS
eukprot:CAMPEP_0203755800 /NCGR_PEP_ID=MMETSP0098-20131031/9170_1 /ASSEMBLY_ACC=CAM_ASM_000208 /TAXON_ID=96639 /ORGANISM=" , Strain NY0313808BC1" /LENGTH=495 /DNA_ID=CAMNT_0050647399 /DNA_START=380 /DNA_END=1867 /DNA_ORIENTATION=-